MTKIVQHSFKPVAVTAGFKSDNHFTRELGVKFSHINKRLMRELKLMKFAISGVRPLDELLASVKINTKISRHGDSSLVLKFTASLNLAAR